MAYVVARPNGAWEIRESTATERGPRARTLGYFRILTDAVIDKALARAGTQVERQGIVRAAARAGAPIAGSAADGAARLLIAEVAGGRQPAPRLRRLLAHALHSKGGPPSANVRAMLPWMTAHPRQRAEALRDLLLLADRVPFPRRRTNLNFPRIESGAE